MYMVVFVLDNPNLLDDVLDAWEEIGVQGVTFFESSGINRRRAQRVGAPFMLGLHRLMEKDGREGHFTLFTVVDTKEVVQACVTAAESVVGDLNDPHTGLLAAWPLSIAKGDRTQAPPKTEVD